MSCSMESHLKSELKGISAYIEQQLSSGWSTKAPCWEALCTSVTTMINEIKGTITPAGAADILRVLKESAFRDHEKDLISACLQERIKSSVGKVAVNSIGKWEKQTWHKREPITILRYLTPSDWDTIDDQSLSWNNFQKANKIVKRLSEGGLRKPDEKMSADIVSLLASRCWNPNISLNKLYEKAQNVKAMFATERSLAWGPYLMEYPAYPKDMPSQIYDIMYDDEKPLDRSEELRVDVIRVGALSSTRSSNKHVRDGFVRSAIARAPKPRTKPDLLMITDGSSGTETVPPLAIADIVKCAAGSGMPSSDIVALVNACNGRNQGPPPESYQPTHGKGKLPHPRSSSSLSCGSQDIGHTVADGDQKGDSPTPSTNVDEPKAGEPKAGEPRAKEPRAEAGESTALQLEADSKVRQQLAEFVP